MASRLAVRVAAIACAAAGLIPVATSPAWGAAEQISAHVATAHPTVGQDLDIVGQVTGATSYPATVSATRDDSTSTGSPVGAPVMTDGEGNFTITDNPPARGTVTYHLSADAGAATTDVTTQVAGKTTDLSISVRPRHADSGTRVRVTAHLGSGTSNRDVTLSARPYHRSTQQFDSGPVDAQGNRSAEHSVERRTTFIASFAGDSAFAPARATVAVAVRAVIVEKLRGGYATRHGVRLYHRNADVSIFLHMRPGAKGTCLIMRAQRRYSGAWHNAAVSNCHDQPIRTNAQGEVIAQLQHPHVVGDPYRIRAEYRGSKAVGARHGHWLHLEFRG